MKIILTGIIGLFILCSFSEAVDTIQISHPLSGAVVSGNNVLIQVAASGAIKSVSCNIYKKEGWWPLQMLGRDNSMPFEFKWDTTKSIYPNGEYTIRVWGYDSPKNTKSLASASMTVMVKNDRAIPSISITNPINNEFVSGVVNVMANASDDTGIASVQFRLNGQDLGVVDNVFPYEVDWDTTHAIGEHVLNAIAIDVSGKQATSSNIFVQVKDITNPLVQIIEPASGTPPLGALIHGEVVLLTASASDNIGVHHVDFKLKRKSDNVSVFSETDNTYPYQVSLNTLLLNDATYLLEVMAYDASGNSGQHFRTLTIDNTNPSVSILSPEADAIVSGDSVLYKAEASDSSGISYVEFFADGITLGIDDVSPYEVLWDTTSYERSTVLTVRAYDELGNSSASLPVNVNVDNDLIPPVIITDGWDWSLPSEIQASEKSGMFLMACNSCGIDNAAPPASLQHLFKIRGKTVYWSRLNPGDGVFDFSEIINDLADAHEKGYAIVFRLKSNETANDNSFGDGFSHVPVWIIHKYAASNPVLSAYMKGSSGASRFIKVAAVWNGFDLGETSQNPGMRAGLHDEYLKFVKAFGERGFHHDQAFAGLYLTGYSASYGEEMVISPENYPNLTAIGMSPDFSNLVETFNARMTAWARAFGNKAYKLVWTGAILFGTGLTWTGEPGHAMNQHALNQGLGIRGGTVETPFANVFTPYPYHDYGTLLVNGSTDKEGYLKGNWAWVIKKEKRFHGEENEAIGLFSGYEESMYRDSILMSLLRGVNYLWTDKNIVPYELLLSEYYIKEAGKGPDEVFDAWIYLRESEQRFGSVSNYIIKNFEHGLHQGEVETAKTVRAKFTLRTGTSRDCDIPGVDDGDSSNGGLDRGDFLARRTDVASGQNEIRIYVNDQFMRSNQKDNTTLKVTYTDNGGEWYVRYCTNSGVKSSDHVVESESGLEKTATFILKNFMPNKAITGGFDLALSAEGQDLTASFVRLIKTKPNVEVQS